jgi:hypothetical protein
MTQSRSVTFTHVQTNEEQTVIFPNLQRASLFVLTLHAAGVQAIVNLLPEDVAV